MTVSPAASLNVSPGSTVVVRDEEWLVTAVDETTDGPLLHVQGLGELVRGTTAQFYASIDTITPLDPAEVKVVGDDSPYYRKSRLWIEATLRKTPVAIADPQLTVSTHMLADQLPYQATAIRKALNPDNLRPRLLLADTVGLGKTIEIGMILSELVRRGRGERILIVTPRHVLEQMQHEMWSRFALPFVRLDSSGIQQVRQKLPATRNPFTYYRRAIISVDTLKSAKYIAHLKKQRWDAVVIDEAHNVTNKKALKTQLAQVLAPTTDALILASATPHNGRDESFANLMSLLDPTAVDPSAKQAYKQAVERLAIRRHRGSDEVSAHVGSNWAERKPLQHLVVDASTTEDAVADELASTWLYPAAGASPYSGKTEHLFGWTLAKAFLSSPAALEDSISNRLHTIKDKADDAAAKERAALERLRKLNDASLDDSAKYQRLLTYLKHIGVGKNKPMRAVVFAERVATLHWLQDRLTRDLGFAVPKKGDMAAVEVMHGGLSDEEQMAVIESFKQSSEPIRVLVTGDVASEGVNLHRQCHELIHFDIPWSLIRIEQRNGRIDRYGQTQSPQISTLLLSPSSDRFAGDLTVLKKLLDREEAAHSAFGEAGVLMGEYSAGREEEEIKRVLAGQKDFDDVVPDVEAALAAPKDADGWFNATNFLATGDSMVEVDDAPPNREFVLYDSAVEFLADALDVAFPNKSDAPSETFGKGGVNWVEHGAYQMVEFTPPPDLQSRLQVLPQSYLSERKVLKSLKLATTRTRGNHELEAALNDQSKSSWPEAHYLGPLHPVLDWAADRALGGLDRSTIYALRGTVDKPTVLMIGTLTNRRGQVVARAHVASNGLGVRPYRDAAEMLADCGVGATQNPGPVEDAADLSDMVRTAVQQASSALDLQMQNARRATEERVERWLRDTEEWKDATKGHQHTKDLLAQLLSVEKMRSLIEQMVPDRHLVRPIAVVVPMDAPAHVKGAN